MLKSKLNFGIHIIGIHLILVEHACTYFFLCLDLIINIIKCLIFWFATINKFLPLSSLYNFDYRVNCFLNKNGILMLYNIVHIILILK